MNFPNRPVDIQFGDMIARYTVEPDSGRVGFTLLPAAMMDALAERRATLAGEPFIEVLPGDGEWPARRLDPLSQVKMAGDPEAEGFAAGHTMRNSASALAFRWESQEREGNSIVTTLRHPNGCRLAHHLRHEPGSGFLELGVVFHNDSPRPVTLEMLASFSLGGITPFEPADATGRLVVHRFRSVWAAEGRHDCATIENLHLERSWSGAGSFSERFGQTGSLPVRKWFPFLAIEDHEAGVLWGARLSWAGSWQMEIHRQHDELSISGGLADFEFGHWRKSLAPGEFIAAPAAYLSCTRGSLDDLCRRLNEPMDRAVAAQPAVEQELPVIFNEFCTTWGNPSAERLDAIAARLQGTGVRYLVIDAGWYRPRHVSWEDAHGDWEESAALFPEGLAATADAIRNRGLIPGIWFEMETVGETSAAFSLVDRLLHRHGQPITVRKRRFWDLRDESTSRALEEKISGIIRDAGFGYLKVDYNETLGIGCDDADSLGEGLRQQVLASHRLFDRLRARFPDLVIENCASGGHRLEPSMISRTAMSSFSDAHELPEIPIIAAGLQRLLPPRQSQIWAVLHAGDSERRLLYSLAATFLGRMCLSGGIAELDARQWSLARSAIALYHKAAPVIRDGTSTLHRAIGPSWRHPTGWQAVVRQTDTLALVVTHAFADAPDSIDIPLSGDWEPLDGLAGPSPLLQDGRFRLAIPAPFTGNVHLLVRAGSR